MPSVSCMRCFHCRFDPLWNSLVVGGLDHNGKPFLGTVGMIGTAYTDDHVATGASRQRVLSHMHSETGNRNSGWGAECLPPMQVLAITWHDLCSESGTPGT